jgi:hypothetical protein
MARPRKPLAILKFRGTYRKDRHGPSVRSEPEAPGVFPTESPEWMSSQQRNIWHQLVGGSMPGLWRPIDAPLVSTLAAATSDLLIVNRAMGEQLVMDEPDHKVLKLYAKLADETADVVLKLSRALLATPLARSEARMPPPREGCMMGDTAPVIAFDEVLRLLSLGERVVLASHAGAPGGLRPPTDRAVGLVLVDSDSSAAGPCGFPTALKARIRRRASVAVLAAPEPPLGAIIALARMLGEDHSVALVLTPPERLST